MKSLHHLLKFLLFAHYNPLTFSLNTSLTLCGITDSSDFLIFHKHKCKSETIVKKNLQVWSRRVLTYGKKVL